MSAQRGLASIFQALARKTSIPGLSKPNLRDGLTLMHYAVGYFICLHFFENKTIFSYEYLGNS